MKRDRQIEVKIPGSVTKNIRHFRELKGLSQEELAFDADLHRTHVSGVERGIRNPTVVVLAKLATALGVEPSKLLECRR